MSTSFETESQKSPETLEQEIDAKRASINNIVDSLESRLTPGQLFDQALSYAKGNGGEFFQNLGTTLKNNPVPSALTGLGLAWLAMNQNKPFNPGGPSSGHGLGEQVSGAIDKVTGAMSQVGDRLHNTTDSVRTSGQGLKDKASDLTHRATDSIHSSSSHLRQTAHDATDQLSTQGSQLKKQYDQMLKEQPLVLAAIGIGLGALIGAALPITRKEDELLGEASDDAVGKIKSKGEEAYSALKDTVKQAADSGKPVDQQGDLKTNRPAESDTDRSPG